MREPIQLPAVNALVGDDKDVLRTIFLSLVAEINRLRNEVESLRSTANRGGY